MRPGALTFGRTREADADRYWADYHWRVGNPALSRRHTLLENSALVSGAVPLPQFREVVFSGGSLVWSGFDYANENDLAGLRFHRGHHP